MKLCPSTGRRHHGLLANFTVLSVLRSLVKRAKKTFGGKRRSISGTSINTNQFKKTKIGGCIAYL
jgi:hypothetical protein